MAPLGEKDGPAARRSHRAPPMRPRGSNTPTGGSGVWPFRPPPRPICRTGRSPLMRRRLASDLRAPRTAA